MKGCCCRTVHNTELQRNNSDVSERADIFNEACSSVLLNAALNYFLIVFFLLHYSLLASPAKMQICIFVVCSPLFFFFLLLAHLLVSLFAALFLSSDICINFLEVMMNS